MIVTTLVRYGYHGMYALDAIIEERAKEQLWQEYVANMLCLNVRPKYTNELTLFSDLIAPKSKPVTAEEVKAHILKRLRTKKVS